MNGQARQPSSTGLSSASVSPRAGDHAESTVPVCGSTSALEGASCQAVLVSIVWPSAARLFRPEEAPDFAALPERQRLDSEIAGSQCHRNELASAVVPATLEEFSTFGQAEMLSDGKMLRFGERRLNSPPPLGRPLYPVRPEALATLASKETQPPDEPKPRVLDRVRQAIRTCHYIRRIENAYVHWIKRYIFFHSKREPAEMAETEVAALLSSLAVQDPIPVSVTSKAKIRIIVIRHGDRVRKPCDIPKQPTGAEWREAVDWCRRNLDIIQKEAKEEEKKKILAKRIGKLDQLKEPEYELEGVARLDEKDRDALSPLKREEEARIKALKATLAGADASFDLVRSSSHLHAMQTADLLADSKQSIQVNDALTPSMPDRLFNIATIVPTDIKPGDTLTLVGHENRLSQIIVLLTSKRLRPLNQLDVVCVEADSRADLLLGCAKVVWRVPVVAYEEETLRPKVNSKMTAATFLAGFTATAWIQVVMNAKMPPIPWPKLIPAEAVGSAVGSNEPLVQLVLQWCAVAAMLCLSAALACFVSAVFIYDRLNMPVGFWEAQRQAPYKNLPKLVRDNKDRHGLIYGYMLHAWERRFFPGVCFAALGLLLTAASKTSLFSLLSLIVLVIVYAVYRRKRPEVGVD